MGSTRRCLPTEYVSQHHLPFNLIKGLTRTSFVLSSQATGCGKTHTINGCYDESTTPRTLKEKGVIHLTMDHLFALIAEKSDKMTAQLSFSYLEIYNETIRDLLTDADGPRNGLALRKDEKNRISVPGLTEVRPDDADAIHEAVEAGNKRRRTEMTNANKTSSRSHAVLQINVRVRPLEAGLEESISVATLSIIDLAGSERAAATSNLGARMKEGSSINKSLLSLGNCINALCQRGNRHIPYRDSKLTRLLEFSLGGNCKTCMIVCISPSTVHYDDTQNTLKYANRAKQIKTDVSRNSYNVSTHVKQYVQKIAELSETVGMLQKKLDEKASQDGAAEVRRREEMRVEVDKARSDVVSKASQTKEQIVDGALCEAILFATEARLKPIRTRLAEIDKLQPPLASTLVAERDVLVRLARPDEELLKSSTLQFRLQSSAKSKAMFESVIRAVRERRMDKLDNLAKEMVTGTAKVCNSEMEVEKLKVSDDKLRSLARDQAERVAQLAAVFARTMSAVKDAQGRLDLWEALGEERDSAAVKAVSKNLSDTVHTSSALLDTLLSSAAMGASSTGRASPSKSQPYVSPSSFPFVASSAPPPQPSSAINKPRIRRSLAGGSAVGLASPAKRASALKVKSISSPHRPYRTSTLGSTSSAKKIRWRDEAGQGNIDDASRLSGTIEEDAEWEDEKAEVSPTATFAQPVASTSNSSPTPLLQPSTFKVPMMPKSAKSSRPPQFSTLAEENTSSPFASSSTLSAPPSLFARKPLGDGSSGLNANSSFSLSSRQSPDSTFNVSNTKAFSLFSAGPQASPLRQPPVRSQRVVSSPAKRRVSNVGPMRTEKKRGRSSLIPVASPPGNGEHPTFHEITPKTSALGGGARRILMTEAGPGSAGAMKSPKKAALPPARGPRPSLMGPMRPRASLAPSSGPVPSYALPTASKTAAVTENLKGRASMSSGGPAAAWR